MEDLIEMLKKQSEHWQEVADKELDRIMSYQEVADFTNYTIASIQKDKNVIGGFKPHGKVIGFRKRNVIAWIKKNEEVAKAKIEAKAKSTM